MVALILSCGGSPEPLIFSIKKLNPDYVYFLCSNDSKNEVANIIKESEFLKEYDIKIVKDHENLDESFLNLPVQNKISSAFNFVPPDGFLGSHITWRYEKYGFYD